MNKHNPGCNCGDCDWCNLSEIDKAYYLERESERKAYESWENERPTLYISQTGHLCGGYWSEDDGWVSADLIGRL